MRRVLLIAVLASLPCCTTMRNIGQGICSTQEEISQGMSSAASFFGVPGTIVSGALDIILSTTCKMISGVLSAPADLTNDVMGVFTDEAEIADPEEPVEPRPAN